MSDDLVERLQLVANFCYAHRADTSAATCQEAAARITALQADLAAARAELAALKDVEADTADMAVAGANKAIRVRFGSGEADGRERWLVRAGAAAIAPALIARERERAAEVCKSIVKQELEAGNYISAAIAKMIEERIRTGAAPPLPLPPPDTP